MIIIDRAIPSNNNTVLLLQGFKSLSLDRPSQTDWKLINLFAWFVVDYKYAPVNRLHIPEHEFTFNSQIRLLWQIKYLKYMEG